MDNLSRLNEKDADSLKDAIDMAKEELIKLEPKAGRLRNCLNLITPMITVVNNVPVLVSNLQKLTDYITSFI